MRAVRHGLLAQARRALVGKGCLSLSRDRVLLPGGTLGEGLASHRRRHFGAAVPVGAGAPPSWGLWERYCRVLEGGGWRAVLAKATTSAVIGFAGDLLCQMFVERPMLPAESLAELEILTPLELIEVANSDETDGPEFDWGEIDVNTSWGVEIATEASSRFRVWLYKGLLIRQNETAAPDLTRSLRFAALAAAGAPIGHLWYGYLGKRFPGQGTLRVIQKVFADQLLYSPPFFSLVFTLLAICEGKTLEELKEVVYTDVPTTIVASWKIWGPVQVLNFKFVPVHLQVLFVNCVGLFWNTYMSWIIHRKPPAEGVPSSYSEPAEESPPAPPVDVLQRTLSLGASNLKRMGSGKSGGVLPRLVGQETVSNQNQPRDDESEEEGE